MVTLVMVGVALLAGAGSAGAQMSVGLPAPEVRQAAPAVDALWALGADQYNPSTNVLGVCQNPTLSASISGCFGAYSSVVSAGSPYPPVTDGTNVYFGAGAGNSCPVVDYGRNCTQVQIGVPARYGTPNAFTPTSVAAGGGYLWLGGAWGASGASGGTVVYRCPADLPYTAATSMPPECVQVYASDGLGPVVAANGTVYIGAMSNSTGAWVIVTCQYDATSCGVLNSFGRNARWTVRALAAGGGYLWAGLQSGQIYRCSPAVLNDCQLWDTAGQPIVSLADDGQGTLWAAANGGGTFTHSSDVVWSCPEATANACKTIISNVFPWQVTAGGGQGFSSVNNGSAYPP
ncbi:MAG: hypothetical protein ACKOTH_07955, partial [Solirubrobacterales bacterium]